MSTKNKISNTEQAKKKYLPYLLGIIGISLTIKIFYFNSELPLTLDSLGYFFYAYEFQLTGELPNISSIKNNGWPLFLSVFFSIFPSNEILSYMQIQKILSIILSSLTVIPVYFLCRKFFSFQYSLIGASIFGFEPRLIQNSLFGITEPLYIFLGTIALVLFLSDNKKYTYLAFAVTALVSIVRAEGVFLFFVLSIMFFIKWRKEKFVIPKYFVALSGFFIILIPIMVQRLTTIGNDAIFGRVAAGIERNSNSDSLIIYLGIENFIKFLGWDLIPIFIIFVPIGIFLIFKKFNVKKLVLISSLVSLSLPAIYAYSVPALDTRYLFILYPIFCVISLYPIKRIGERFNNQKLFSGIIIITILAISICFIEIKLIDVNSELEAYNVAKYLAKSPNVINYYSSEASYIEPSEIILNWDKWKDYFNIERESGESIRSVFPHEVKLISTESYNGIEEFISENYDNDLNKIVVQDLENTPEIFRDIFHNEEKYPYLTIDYQTTNEQNKFYTKIFSINYEKFPFD